MTVEEYNKIRSERYMTNKVNERAFRVVILVEDGRVFEPDICDPSNIDISSTMTEHPLVNGDTIGDHMYRDNSVYTLSGAFSLRGSGREIEGSYSDRLSNIEEAFEEINKKGLFCTIIKRSKEENSKERFLKRDNMVLTSIRWTENQNSLGFSFTFNEALLADVQTDDYMIQEGDEDLPILTQGLTMSFVEDALDMSEVDKIIGQILFENNLFQPEFLENAITEERLASLTKAGIAGVVAGAAAIAIAASVIAIKAGAAIASFLGATTAASASTGPVGWIVGGAIVVVSAIGTGLYFLFKSIDAENKIKEAQKQFGIEQFKYYKDERKFEAELDRCSKYISSIHETLLTLNDAIQIYALSTDQNQDCMISIDDSNYIFSFFKNSNSSAYSLKIYEDTDVENSKKSYTNIEELAKSNIFDLNNSNYILQTYNNGYKCYILNRSNMTDYDTRRLDKDDLTEDEKSRIKIVPDQGSMSDADYVKLCTEIDKNNDGVYAEARNRINNIEKHDLRNYAIVVSQINMDKFGDTLREVVLTGMRKY